MSTSVKAARTATLHNTRQLTEDCLGQAASSTGASRIEWQDKAIELNVGFAEAIASRYAGRGQDRQDLNQVASMGLVNAVRRFEPGKGNFYAFASTTMTGELKRYFRDRTWTIRPPRRLQERQAEVVVAAAELGQSLHRDASPGEIAAYLHADVAEVVEALRAHACYAADSLDASRGGSDDRVLGETVPSSEDGFGRAEAVAMMAPAIRDLAERDRRLIYLRFFCGKTQQEVADELGVTQMQVSRMQKRILGELRVVISGGDEPMAA